MLVTFIIYNTIKDFKYSLSYILVNTRGKKDPKAMTFFFYFLKNIPVLELAVIWDIVRTITHAPWILSTLDRSVVRLLNTVSRDHYTFSAYNENFKESGIQFR